MKWFEVVLLIVCSLIIFVSAEDSTDENVLVESWTGEDMVASFKSSFHIILVVYAPWCSHCKKLMPDLETASKVLVPLGIRVGKVNGDEEEAYVAEWLHLGFPSVTYIRDGYKLSNYKGDRTADDIIQWALDLQKVSDEKAMELSVDYELDWGHESKSKAHDEQHNEEHHVHETKEFYKGSGIIAEWTEDNVEREIQHVEHLLLEVYAPWYGVGEKERGEEKKVSRCSFCQKLAPWLEEAALELESEGIAVARINGDEGQDFRKKIGVTGYPTLIYYFHGHEVVEGRLFGASDASSIVTWALEKKSENFNPSQPSANVGIPRTAETFEEPQEDHHTCGARIVRVELGRDISWWMMMIFGLLCFLAGLAVRR